MTINEFRAWLAGFSEAIGEAPTPEQWAKIKAKLEHIQEAHIVPWPSTAPTQPVPPYAPPQTIPPWVGPRLGEVTCVTSSSYASN